MSSPLQNADPATEFLSSRYWRELWERDYLGNSVERWAYAALVLVVVFLLLGVLKRVLVARLAKLAARTTTEVDDLFVDLVRRTKRFFFFVLALYVAHHVLDWSAARGETPESFSNPERVIRDILVVGFWIQAAFWGLGLVAFAIAQLVKGRGANDPARTMGVTVLGFIGNLVVWSIVLLSSLDALGVPVTSLIASLGVGGIAVALAAQNVLGDLFASISILLDKPFVIGDAIQVGEFTGTIERIGIKSTRLRSVNGEEIIMGNHDLVSSRIRNYKRSKERRIVLAFGIEYSTPPDVVARVPDMVRSIIEATPGTRFDRSHMKGFGDSALQFEAVYFSLNEDYGPMMDVQQKVNLALLNAFAEEGIEFAFPTQTVRHVEVGHAGTAETAAAEGGDAVEANDPKVAAAAVAAHRQIGKGAGGQRPPPKTRE
jgi:small-conductance mechanosensitive channel